MSKTTRHTGNTQRHGIFIALKLPDVRGSTRDDITQLRTEESGRVISQNYDRKNDDCDQNEHTEDGEESFKHKRLMDLLYHAGVNFQ